MTIRDHEQERKNLRAGQLPDSAPQQPVDPGQLALDQLTLGQLTLDQLILDQLTLDQLTLDQLTS